MIKTVLNKPGTSLLYRESQERKLSQFFSRKYAAIVAVTVLSVLLLLVVQGMWWWSNGQHANLKIQVRIPLASTKNRLLLLSWNLFSNFGGIIFNCFFQSVELDSLHNLMKSLKMITKLFSADLHIFQKHIFIICDNFSSFCDCRIWIFIIICTAYVLTTTSIGISEVPWASLLCNLGTFRIL